MKGFLYFIRTQGIVGLAIGFILGTAVIYYLFKLLRLDRLDMKKDEIKA